MDSTVNSEEPGRGDARLARLAEQLSSLGREAPHHPSDPPARTDKARTAVSSNYTPLGGRPRRAFAGLVLVACVSIAAILYWLPPSGDTAKTALHPRRLWLRPPRPVPFRRLN